MNTSMDLDAGSVASIGDSSINRRIGESSTWGGLSASCIADRINTMRSQEADAYDYSRYSRLGEAFLGTVGGRHNPTSDDADMNGNPPSSSNNGEPTQDVRLNSSWREKICHWSYSVVDHFELSRETVAISIDLFDRYLATRGNRCNGSSALLTSLTTLYIAIKLNEPKKIKLTTLSNLSRGQFFPPDIEEMEFRILSSLDWMVHPPTVVSFVSHFLLFLPQVHSSVRKDIFELARYLAELSICDAFFVDCSSSTIAYSAVLNVMDDISLSRISAGARHRFLAELYERVGLDHRDDDVRTARERLREIFASSMGYDLQEKASAGAAAAKQPSGEPTGGHHPSSSSGAAQVSNGGFAPQAAQPDDVGLLGYHGNNRPRTNSTDSGSVGSLSTSRFSASPLRRGGGLRAAAAGMGGAGRSRQA